MIEAIRNAKRPILYVGGGCVDSRECLRRRRLPTPPPARPGLPSLPCSLRLGPPRQQPSPDPWPCSPWPLPAAERAARCLLSVTLPANTPPHPTQPSIHTHPASPPPRPAPCLLPLAAAEVKEFVAHTGIPVCQTLMALGSFPETDPLALQVRRGGHLHCCALLLPRFARPWAARPRRALLCLAPTRACRAGPSPLRPAPPPPPPSRPSLLPLGSRH